MKIQECIEVMGRFFYYFENSPNPIVEQIKFCPFCGVKLNFEWDGWIAG